MKPQDYAIPTLGLGLLAGAIIALCGYLFLSAGIVLVALVVSNSMWQPVKYAKAESDLLLDIYRKAKGMGRGNTREEWVRSLTYEQMMEIREDYRLNGFGQMARWWAIEWDQQQKWVSKENKDFKGEGQIGFDIEHKKYTEQKMNEKKLAEQIQKAQERLKVERNN